jgi:hypothetical protein
MAQAKNETAEVPDEAPAVVPVEAAAVEKQPEVDAGKPKSVTANVWAPSGPIPKASVLQTAIQSVRDAIPVVYELEAEITGAKKTKQDGADGTTFEVTITYTPRATVGKPDPVDLDRVISGLDVPRSFDGIGGHDGDPDFHDRKPTEL